MHSLKLSENDNFRALRFNIKTNLTKVLLGLYACNIYCQWRAISAIFNAHNIGYLSDVKYRHIPVENRIECGNGSPII